MTNLKVHFEYKGHIDKIPDTTSFINTPECNRLTKISFDAKMKEAVKGISNVFQKCLDYWGNVYILVLVLLGFGGSLGATKAIKCVSINDQ